MIRTRPGLGLAAPTPPTWFGGYAPRLENCAPLDSDCVMRNAAALEAAQLAFQAAKDQYHRDLLVYNAVNMGYPATAGLLENSGAPVPLPFTAPAYTPPVTTAAPPPSSPPSSPPAAAPSTPPPAASAPVPTPPAQATPPAVQGSGLPWYVWAGSAAVLLWLLGGRR